MTLLVGHVTRKIVSKMTYNVSSETLNSTILVVYLFSELSLVGLAVVTAS